ncbi:MarR family winged helix-turn-helix transcriptional regulator [Sphingomonas sp. SRS2]|uniref:MarR family winged helix-turn-helix transcriptional regulator n=1 Tax=Sphingomonas sp. SRS2 TaxID=133190 RepID=UPI0006184EDF|nr:MarR family transcriptional regulator [Sphingomonas sp. SRS2]KKC27657.1 hypothetical protein WP12_01960 [Sphingomonas sp. SRS2]
MVTGDPASDHFIPDDYLFVVVAHTAHLYNERIAQALRPTGTDRARWRLLLTLWQGKPLSIKEIVEITNFNQSTVSKIIDRMKRDDWVNTESRRSDSRFTDISLTERGHQVLIELTKVASREYWRSLDGVSESDLQTTLNTLHKIMKNIAAV